MKNFILISNTNSVRKNKISILAVLETIGVLILSLYIAYTWDTKIHIIISASLAPFFFLQTTKSREEGLKYIHKITPSLLMSIGGTAFISILILYFLEIITLEFIFEEIYSTEYTTYFGLIMFVTLIITITYTVDFFTKKISYNNIRNEFNLKYDKGIGLIINLLLTPILIFMIMYYTGFILVFEILLILFFIIIVIFFIRMIATIKTLSENSFKSIPINWYKQILCTDSYYMPEVLPGIESSNHWLKFSNSSNWEILKSGSKLKEGSLTLKIRNYFVLALFYLPTILFRLSLKSSAWIFLPLVWITRVPEKTKQDFELQLEDVYDTPTAFISILLAYFSILLLLIKIFVLPIVEIDFLDELVQRQLLSYEINLWNITAFIASILTLIYFYFFPKIVRRLKYNKNYKSYLGVILWNTIPIKNFFSYFSIFVMFYFIWSNFYSSNEFNIIWNNLKDNLQSMRYIPF